MQTYCCNHCHFNSESIFEIFLHIFTDHLHHDVGLDSDEGQSLLKKTYLYQASPQTLVSSRN
ncbi:MAG: hypothetical protein FJ020_04855 [Chloroflexi bacterium]|nr:hypothetical protein [Chloroflexota bacterium]